MEMNIEKPSTSGNYLVWLHKPFTPENVEYAKSLGLLAPDVTDDGTGINFMTQGFYDAGLGVWTLNYDNPKVKFFNESDVIKFLPFNFCGG